MFVKENAQEKIVNLEENWEWDSQIAKDWDGGYELKINLTALSEIEQWQVDFVLPYAIEKVVGAELSDHGAGKYTLSGLGKHRNLQKGQSITPTLVVDDQGELALLPELAMEPKIINVERDYDGDLAQAIAAAQDGDTVRLGNKTYYIDGLVVDKDIVIAGRQDTVIDGGGTSQAIFYLTSGATGATLRDLEITNGNNGIIGEGAKDLTLRNLEIHNIGLEEVIRDGTNNTGISLHHASGFKVLNSRIYDIGKKGVGIVDTDQGLVEGLEIRNVNIAAEHAQSHDAAGIKLFNTNEIVVKGNYFSDINAIHLWSDITNNTSIIGNVMLDVGSDFLAPVFNNNVEAIGIYNEKSPNSIVRDNKATSVEWFTAFRATEFTTETLTLGDNDFSSFQLGTTDYWANESAERLIALTEDPLEADFSLYAEEYLAEANIGV